MDQLEVELKRTGVAWGRLTNSITGEPVNGYTIMVRLRRLSKSDFFPVERLQRSSRARVLRGPEAARLAKVDPSENLFALTDIPINSFEISIDASGYVIRTEKEIQVDAGKIVEISTILDPESRISGSVVDHRGDPVVGAKIWVRPADPVEIARLERAVHERSGSRHPGERVESDPQGRFTIGRLEGMKYRLHASHGAHLDSPKQDVEPRTGEHQKDFVCELGASGTLA